MAFLTNEKLTIVGAAGMIGSNMAQTALMMGLTSNLCLYDVFSPEGVAEEMRQCGFDGVNITATTDVKEAFTDAKYIISSGGAPRKAGMTREDLLKGNCEIAEQLGKDIKTYCPDVKHVVIIFNPADLTVFLPAVWQITATTPLSRLLKLAKLSPSPNALLKKPKPCLVPKHSGRRTARKPLSPNRKTR